MSQDYQIFVGGIKEKTGIDLNAYKEAQMKRRLQSLQQKKEATTILRAFISKWRQMSNCFKNF